MHGRLSRIYMIKEKLAEQAVLGHFFHEELILLELELHV